MKLPLRCGFCGTRFRVWALTALGIRQAQKTRSFQVMMQVERLSKEKEIVAAGEELKHIP